MQTPRGLRLRRFPSPTERPDYLTLNRHQLFRRVFELTAARTRITLGRTLMSVQPTSEGVDVVDSDGVSERFDLLVAADGVRSRVRSAVFGEGGARFLRASYVAFACPDRIGLDATYDVWGRHLYANIYPAGAGQIGAYFIYPGDRADPLSPGACRQFLLHEFGRYAAPISTLLAQTSADDVMFHDSIVVVEPPTWHVGRVVLLGDAAHCVSLVSGHGVSMAMTGAWVLADALAAHRHPERAAAAYQQAMQPVVRLQRGRAEDLLRMMFPPTALGRGVRLLAAALLPRRSSARALAEDVAAQRLLERRGGLFREGLLTRDQCSPPGHRPSPAAR